MVGRRSGFLLGFGPFSGATVSFRECTFLYVSNENYPSCLRYIGDYTTQLYRDYFINHDKGPYKTTRISMNASPFFFFRGSFVFFWEN